jgi:hypothetical protein
LLIAEKLIESAWPAVQVTAALPVMPASTFAVRLALPVEPLA